MQLAHLALLVLSCCYTRAEPVTADGQPIRLAPDRGVATYHNSFDQPAGFTQTCFSLTEPVIWRREQWEDLLISQGGAVVYKLQAEAPMTSARLSFAAWATAGWDIGVHASPDGVTWTELFAHDDASMGSGRKLRVTLSLDPCLSADRMSVYIKFAPARAGMLLYDFSVRARFSQDLGQNRADQYTPGKVPPAGRLRYVIYYGDADPTLMDFVREARVNFLHWHGPFCGYHGLPEVQSLPWTMRSVADTVREAHDNGSMIVCYVGPVFSYGDPGKRTQIFDMYDRQWEQYRPWLGERPPADPLAWTQRDPDGNPVPYQWGDDTGYYLCVNSPAVRQYDKGLLWLISACGADGVFYDGPAFARGLCYCPDCAAGFRRYLEDYFSPQERRDLFGTPQVGAIQPPREAGSPLYIAYRRFMAWSLQDFLRDTRDAIRAQNPHFIMTANYCMWEGDPFGILSGCSEDLELWAQVLDLVFEEGCTEKTPRTAGGIKFSNAANYKYLLAASQGKPVAELAYMTTGQTPAAQENLARLAVAEGLMGAAAWQVPFGQTNEFGRAGIVAAHAWQEANEHLLVGQTPYTNVGILASMTQAYCGETSWAMAVSRFLTDHQVDHRMVIDRELADGLPAGLEVLILPRTPCLSTAQIANLVRFAETHRLVLIGPCGTHDQWGRPRQTPLETRLKPFQENVVSLPAVPLPATGRRGLSAEARAALAPLLGVLEDTAPLVTLAADSSVEFAAYRTPEDRFTVHLVNFAVDLDGRVTERSDLDLRFTLPPGYVPTAVELRSPDPETTGLEGLPQDGPGTAQDMSSQPALPEAATRGTPTGRGISPSPAATETAGGKPVDFDLLRLGPSRALLIRVPRLYIHDLLVISTRREAPPPPQLPRMGITGDRSVPLGASAELRVRVVAPAGTAPEDVRITPQLPPGAQAKLLGQDALALEELSLTRVFQVRLPPAAAVGSTIPVRFEAVVAGSVPTRLSEAVLVRVTPPVELSLAVPTHLNSRSGRTAVAVRVDGLTSRPVDARIWLTVPEGWSITPASDRLALRPGTRGETRAILSGPPGVAAQVPLRVRVSAAVGDSVWVTDATALARSEADFQAVTCPHTAGTIKVDGKLWELPWRRTQSLRLGSCREDVPATRDTEAFVLRDSTHLYIAFRCRENEEEQWPAKVVIHGGEVWLDDDVEIFLDPADSHSDYLHIAINNLGTVYAKPPLPGVIAAVRRSPVDWEVEVAIPWAALGGEPAPGSVWAWNLYRTRQPRAGQTEPQLSALFPTGASFHVPAKFGHLLFD